MIKRKNPFGFYCVILILNLSRLLISQMTLLISKIYRVWFLKRPLLISKICRVWFLKWHYDTFDFQNLSRLISQETTFVAFDFSNDTFDFQNLWRLISQMTLEFDFQNFSIFITKWTLMFSKFVEYALWNAFLIVNLGRLISQMAFLISKIV